MIKFFTVKNRRGDILGEIVFSGRKFEVKTSSPEDKKKIEEIINDSLENGISVLGMGGVVLENPCKFGEPMFFEMLEDSLVRRGYVVVEKKI